jgi:hypothetical protein
MSVLVDGEAADLLALEAALRVDPRVKGASLERVVRDPGVDDMGPVVEALTWTTDNKEVLGGLAAAVVAWVASRRTRIRVIVGKRQIEVSSAAVPDPEALALALLEAMQEQGDDV